MRHAHCRTTLLRALTVSLGILALAAERFPCIATAAEPADEGQFAAMLDAGEFAPALIMARQSPSDALRDARLSRLAAAQADSGARQASLSTASEISAASLRSEALRQTSPASRGARGGASAADFQSLIDLITSTVAPTTWDEVGGPGSIGPFAGGVWVDAHGMLRRLVEADATRRLDDVYRDSLVKKSNTAARKAAPLRKVSLSRLERAVQLQLAMGRSPDDAMAALAGVQKIRYVMIYPETNDVVLAGPAGDWHADREGRLVSTDTGRPVLQLDDLVVLLRHMSKSDATFGCSIKPLPESLARTKAFLERSNRTPLKPGARDAWLDDLRQTLGPQEIEYYGLDPRTRVAQVLVEADYRMKLVGIGLEEGTLGVPSYLSMIEVAKGKSPPSLGVLRWWFSLNYQGIAANTTRDAFELLGQGVRVQSENELLEATGQRVHTGESEPLNRRFAENFTRHFPELAAKYPVYADLQNLFDLALACALIQEHRLDERGGWRPSCFAADGEFQPALGFAPKQVESVINHRIINRTQIVAAVSGGVYFDAGKLVDSSKVINDKQGTISSEHQRNVPQSLPRDAWWWD
jgi:hypothetical protein